MVINTGRLIELSCSEDCEKIILVIPRALFAEVGSDHRWQLPLSGLLFAPGPQDDLKNVLSC